ncbi:MAG: DUF6691 family protein [Burkholderiaceae bacterium]
MINKLLFSLLSGAVFAVGLVVSGMTQTSKVIGFLNLSGIVNPQRFGAWDASLAFVMGGALLVTVFAYAITPRAGKKPWAHTAFELPTRTDIDAKLLTGAALFGIGWGLAGYCPGPALASLLSGGMDVLVFTAALLVGMLVAKMMAKQ